MFQKKRQSNSLSFSSLSFLGRCNKEATKCLSFEWQIKREEKEDQAKREKKKMRVWWDTVFIRWFQLQTRQDPSLTSFVLCLKKKREREERVKERGERECVFPEVMPHWSLLVLQQKIRNLFSCNISTTSFATTTTTATSKMTKNSNV